MPIRVQFFRSVVLTPRSWRGIKN